MTTDRVGKVLEPKNCNEMGKMHMWHKGHCNQCGVGQNESFAEAICEVLTRKADASLATLEGRE